MAQEERWATEQVDHPKHYNDHPSGVECIDVVEHMTFNLGNAMKYIWRAGKKGDLVTDLEKAKWYLEREIRKASGIKPGVHVMSDKKAAIESFRSMFAGEMLNNMKDRPEAAKTLMGLFDQAVRVALKEKP